MIKHEKYVFVCFTYNNFNFNMKTLRHKYKLTCFKKCPLAREHFLISGIVLFHCHWNKSSLFIAQTVEKSIATPGTQSYASWHLHLPYVG